jgi:hypothetical protein
MNKLRLLGMSGMLVVLALLAGCGNNDLPKTGLIAMYGCLPSCTVACRGASYACCKATEISSSRSCYTCTCKADGTAAECDAGGPGSYSCSVPAAITDVWE